VRSELEAGSLGRLLRVSCAGHAAAGLGDLRVHLLLLGGQALYSIHEVWGKIITLLQLIFDLAPAFIDRFLLLSRDGVAFFKQGRCCLLAFSTCGWPSLREVAGDVVNRLGFVGDLVT